MLAVEEQASRRGYVVWPVRVFIQLREGDAVTLWPKISYRLILSTVQQLIFGIF
jgi:hypothetical protein